MQACEIAFKNAEGLVIFIDLSVYRLGAVKKAAYKFGDRFHVLIEVFEAGRAKVVLKAKARLPDPYYSAGEFCNEVLDQELREVVASETEGVRNLILAQAFSKTSLIDEGHESADYRVDPFGIGSAASSGSKKAPE